MELVCVYLSSPNFTGTYISVFTSSSINQAADV